MRLNATHSMLAAVLAAGLAGWFIGCQKAPHSSVKFGATFPLSGEVASYGQKAKRGLELAVEERNAKGGLLGRVISIDFQDDRNDKKDAVSIMTKFATIDKLPVVFGSAGSGCTMAIAPIATRNRVVLVSPVSSSAQLSTDGGPFFFRTVPADDVQAELLANWVHAAGKRRVVVIFTNNSWGKPLADGFSARFQVLGGEVVTSEGVAEGTSDFRTLLAKVKTLRGVDAIVSPTYPKEGGIFVKQFKEARLTLPLFGGDNWGSPEFRTIAGSAAEGVYYTAPAESKSPAFADFAARYHAKYGEDPDVFGAYSYDAAAAVFKAVEATQNLDPVGLRDALHKVSFMGVSGEIAFRADSGDLRSEAYSRKTITNGQPTDSK
jgi:branched-chain amino acid transport system substrate-binding protein